ncbi:ribonuclease P protein component RnpA [Gottschalkia purinilytica]|uniref:Ribonuclease P protein component n=1 Tax=Gottschalkia purinilytica TaxID=1503 RepID=A0A0L0W737_GOTPU|nr:ribonuclease P protein component [Gottschalkia purinilytica]KNF07296.1 ribonuclease P protein component RnpA [Gottschalkia purinilytica]
MEKKQRLKSNREFRRVYDTGKSFANKYLVLFFVKNDLSYNRVGFATTKKLGNSVVRSKFKRRLREAYRLNQNKIGQGYDMIFLSRANAKDIDYKAVESAVLHLVKISGLLKKD